MFLLDTNAVVLVLNERDPALSARLDAKLARGTAIALSTIVLYELRDGIARSTRRAASEAIHARFLEMPASIVAFEVDDAEHAGDIRVALSLSGKPIGPYDILIAAQARRRGAVLVTRNRREFERVPGLMVTDWAT